MFLLAEGESRLRFALGCVRGKMSLSVSFKAAFDNIEINAFSICSLNIRDKDKIYQRKIIQIDKFLSRSAWLLLPFFFLDRNRGYVPST